LQEQTAGPARQHAIAQVLEQLEVAAAPMQLADVDLPPHGHGVQHPHEAGDVGYYGAMHGDNPAASSEEEGNDGDDESDTGSSAAARGGLGLYFDASGSDAGSAASEHEDDEANHGPQPAALSMVYEAALLSTVFSFVPFCSTQQKGPRLRSAQLQRPPQPPRVDWCLVTSIFGRL
jgi:hypothetical protein